MTRANKTSIAVMTALLSLSATAWSRGPVANGPAIGGPDSVEMNRSATTPAIPAMGTNAPAIPAMPGNPTAREEVRDNRDASSMHLQDNAATRNDAINRPDLAVTPDLPSQAKGRAESATSGTGITPSVGGTPATREEIRTNRDPNSVHMDDNLSTRANTVNQNDLAVTPDLPSKAQDRYTSGSQKSEKQKVTQRKKKSRTSIN